MIAMARHPLFVCLVGCLLMGFQAVAFAQEQEKFELDSQLAISETPQHSDTPAVFIEMSFRPLLKAGPWTISPQLMGGMIEGRSNAYRRSVGLTGVGLRVRHGNSPWFFEEHLIGTDGRTPAISGPMDFVETLGWGPPDGRWPLAVRHISNANIYEPNRGENMVLLGYRFR